MPRYVQKTNHKKPKFGLWSTIVDAYISFEDSPKGGYLTFEEVLEYFFKPNIEKLEKDLKSWVDYKNRFIEENYQYREEKQNEK